MTKITMLAIGLLLLSGLVSGQRASKSLNVPSAVKAGFVKSFPSATAVKWEKEGADFEANFKSGSKELSAVLNAAGTLLETEEEIPLTALPAAVTTYLHKNYAGKKVKEAARITKAGGMVLYEAELNGKDLIFNDAGQVQPAPGN